MQMVCIDDLVTKDHLLRLIDRAIGIEKGAENHMKESVSGFLSGYFSTCIRISSDM